MNDHQNPVSLAHQVTVHDDRVPTQTALYRIRIRGRLGATALSAFPAMVSEMEGGDTVLTGLLADRSVLFSVLARIEALSLDLVELREVPARAKSPESPDDGSVAELTRRT